MCHLRLNILRTWWDLSMFFPLLLESCVHPETLYESNELHYIPPPCQVTFGVPDWFELTWQSLWSVFFTCWQLTKGGWGADHSLWCLQCCGLPFCQMSQRRHRRTPGQLIKVRCGWMPGVTHNPPFCSPPHTRHPQNTHAHSRNCFLLYIAIPLPACLLASSKHTHSKATHTLLPFSTDTRHKQVLW